MFWTSLRSNLVTIGFAFLKHHSALSVKVKEASFMLWKPFLVRDPEDSRQIVISGLLWQKFGTFRWDVKVADCPAPASFWAFFFCLQRGTWFWWNYLPLLQFGDPWVPLGSALIIVTVFACSQGLVLGVYAKEKEDVVPQFTSAGENFDKLVCGKLREMLNM